MNHENDNTDAAFVFLEDKQSFPKSIYAICRWDDN